MARMTEPRPVLLMGDPRLRMRSREVTGRLDGALRAGLADLHATLDAFRARHGFGRAIAAPQIGLDARAIAVNLRGVRTTLLDPVVTWQSPEAFTMWDDCMSFPGLLVRVRRARSLSVRFHDEGGREHLWGQLDQASSELLQHELDHLDGVLAVDRAEGPDALALREVFDARRAELIARVDYVIGG
jgi:peptide deformylase